MEDARPLSIAAHEDPATEKERSLTEIRIGILTDDEVADRLTAAITALLEQAPFTDQPWSLDTVRRAERSSSYEHLYEQARIEDDLSR